MSRVTLLTEIPAPYRIPLFNALADRVDLRVVFLPRQNPERPYRLHEDELRFDWEVLPGVDLTVGGRWLVVNRGVLRRLRGSDAVVLGGWNQPAFWIALAWARATRTPAYSVGREHAGRRAHGRGRPAQASGCAGRTGFIVPGRASHEYVRTLAPDGAVTSRRTPSTTSCSRLVPADPTSTASASSMSDDSRRRRASTCSSAPCERSTRRSSSRAPDRKRNALRAIAPANVRFLGYVDRDDLPEWYATADVVVLPSLSEPWGMPLNEAAAAGRALVSTDAAGAAWS